MSDLTSITLTIMELLFLKEILLDALNHRKDFNFWSSGVNGELTAKVIICDVLPKIEDSLSGEYGGV